MNPDQYNEFLRRNTTKEGKQTDVCIEHPTMHSMVLTTANACVIGMQRHTSAQ